MAESKWLSKIAKQHNEWIKIVNSFGEYDFAEDVVQEMYIVIYKYASEEKIIKEGIVSRGYIFFTLRSIYFSYYNAKRKVNKVRLDDQENFTQIPDTSEMDEQVGYNEFVTLIDNHIDNWRWYDKTLFNLYRNTDMSIRKIAQETNISWVSIFNTLKKCKQELKEIFKEDYIDYKNKDYEWNGQKD